MLELYLVRHGHSMANLRGLIGGGAPDTQLTEQGVGQSLLLKPYFAERGITRVYVSPTRRAMDTAEGAGFGTLTVDPRIDEIDRGEWRGHHVSCHYTPDLRDRFADDREFSWTFRAPGGESLREVDRRVRSWLRTLESEGGRIAAFSHQVTIGMAIRHVLGHDPRRVFDYSIANASVTRFAYDGRWRVLTIGERFDR